MAASEEPSQTTLPDTEQTEDTPDQGVPEIDPSEHNGDPHNTSLRPPETDAIRFSNTLSHPAIVERAELAGSRNGAVECKIVLTDDCGPSQADSLIDRLTPRWGQAATFDADANVRGTRLSPLDIDRSIAVIDHPLRHLIEYAAAKTGIDQVATFSWQPNREDIAANPYSIEWETVDPIHIEMTELQPAETVNEFTVWIKKLFPPNYPATYFAEIEETVVEKIKAEDSNEIIEKQSSFDIGYALLDDGKAEDKETVIIQGDSTGIPTQGDDPNESEIAQRLAQSDLTEKFQLTVTSPTYLDAIDYEAYQSGKDVDYSGDAGDAIDNVNGSESVDQLLEAWKQQQREIFQGVYDATQEGGYCAVVIGPTKCKGEYIDLSSYFSVLMREIGWEIDEKITWAKLTGGNDKFGTTIQNPYASYFNANEMTEQIIVFQKGETIHRRSDMARIKTETDFVKMELANNLWHVVPEPHNNHIDHPCPYPAEIVYRLILLYTMPNDTVFDPLVGSGTTAKVANHLGRKSLGIDLQPKFIHESRRRAFIEEFERKTQKIVKAFDVPPEYAEIIEEGEGSLQDRLTSF